MGVVEQWDDWHQLPTLREATDTLAIAHWEREQTFEALLSGEKGIALLAYPAGSKRQERG